MELNSRNKQSGMITLSLLVVVGFAMILFTMNAEKMAMSRIVDGEAKPYREYLLDLKNQIELFQVMKHQENKGTAQLINIFPRTSTTGLESDLVSAGLIQACSSSNASAGNCRFMGYTPYHGTMTYVVHTSTTALGKSQYAELQIDLPSKTNKLLYHAYLMELSKLPNIKRSGNKLVMRINPISSQPAFEEGIKHELDKRYLHKDGSSSLTNDWDVSGNGLSGGYGAPKAILNAKEVTVRLSNGRQQRLSEGVVGYVVGKHNDLVPMHSCATGLTPDLAVTPKDLQSTIPANNYSSSGAFQVGHKPEGSSWRLYINHNVKLISTNKWALIHDGYVSAMRVCRRN
ncbi:hypothetical protein SL034_004285 [Vibrio harveyi]|uniref:hypothetical protein n=1 Tax=Vibrio harveyi group TaxID=717610 RepID=UPI000971BCF9|nr:MULTISPECIES: hypothetical protein [Vibrio harveyi group]ELY1989197.1 hypothetical protein [Vibrio harveyi]APX10105.1 hypothetical protein BWP24_28360 [Vibrio campbellii]ARR10608.1 unknow [Vibrio campbellii]WCP78870.1 hypothetical protein PPW95_25550 [Vibrio parahaemolyticus]WHP52935.1 hypothetical protein QMY43_25295 [Vibrio parahaemolyticus]